MTRAISHHGDCASRSWKGLITHSVTSFFSASVNVSTLSMNQVEKSLMYFVTEVPSIGLRNGQTSRSGNWAKLSCVREM